jgi:hypothetical protein
MRAKPVHHLLLVIALVFSQWAGLAHAYKHPLLGDSLHTCQVCLHQHGLDHASSAPACWRALLETRSETPAAVLTSISLATHHRSHSIRAPPVLSR